MVARTEDIVTSASTAVARAALSITAIATELAQRGEGAKAADQIGKLAGGLLNTVGIAQGGAALGIDHPVMPLPKGAVPWVKGAGRGLIGVGVALSVGSKLATDIPNPYLTKDQIATRAGKKAAIGLGEGLVVAGAVAVVGTLAVPVVVPFVAGMALGVTMTILDEHFHLSDKADDGIDAVANEASKLWHAAF